MVTQGEWKVLFSDLHIFCLLSKLKESLTCCSREGCQSVCHRSQGWLLMWLHAHPYPSLLPSWSPHLKPPPPQCTCSIVNHAAKAVTNSDTICRSGKGGFSSGASVGLKPFDMPFRSIHPVNHPQPAPASGSMSGFSSGSLEEHDLCLCTN